MICAELQDPESFSIVGKKGDLGYCIILSMNLNFVGHMWLLWSIMQVMLHQETPSSPMWSINLYKITTNLFYHPTWMMWNARLRCQFHSHFICAWLMFSSVLAKRYWTQEKSLLFEKLFHVSSILLRYFDYLFHYQ